MQIQRPNPLYLLMSGKGSRISFCRKYYSPALRDAAGSLKIRMSSVSGKTASCYFTLLDNNKKGQGH
jgi:hypothetical protein